MTTFKQLVVSRYKVVASTFTHKLNALFSNLMQDAAFQKQVIHDAEDYRDGLADEQLLERAFDALYPEWMKAFEERGNFSGSGVIVYRGISAKESGSINLKNPGVYWTWDAKKVGNYSNVNTDLPVKTISGFIVIDDIDIEETLKKAVWAGYSSEESEHEITLKHDHRAKDVKLVESAK